LAKITKYRRYFLAVAAISMLASCGTTLTFKAATLGLGAAGLGVFSRPDVNLKEKNYAAADFMAVKMKDQVSFDDFILAQPLEEADHAGVSSPLGANISEGVGMRLFDLGYQVLLQEVAAANGNASLYPKSPNDPDFILKGSYRYGKKHMDIFLRLVEAKSARVVSSFDYSLPLSKEVRDLSKTKARISRVPSSKAN